MSNRPLNVGLIGGGKGAFIVQPHQKAIHFDGTRRVVAGALFPDPKVAMEEAANWPYPIKGYGSYEEMFAANAKLPDDQKLDYIGNVRWVDSYYLQGWLATKLEATGQMQAAWRTNPKLAGGSGCGGDIGTHALMQLRYVTGLDVEALSGNLEKFVEGRPIDDHFTTYCSLGNDGKALVRA